MDKVEVVEVDRYRDGGTILYEDSLNRQYWMWYPTQKVYNAYPQIQFGEKTSSKRVKEILVELVIVANF